MKVLVTGATGLIGQRLCKELLKENHKLVIVGRGSEEQFRKKFTLPCEYHSWSNLDVSGVQAVFHLAGESIAGGRWNKARKDSLLRSRIETTKKLIKAFDGQWPETFIGASAIGYYGDQGSTKLYEDSPPGNNFLSTVCKEWEMSSQAFDSKSRVVRFRIGVVFDSNGGFLEPMETLFSLGLGGRISHGNQFLSWIHAQDLINMFIFALKNPIRGTFNAVAPQPITNKEWTSLFVKTMKTIPSLPVPRIALKLVLGEMSCLALDSQNVSCEKILNHGFQFEFPKANQALLNLYQWKNKYTEQFFSAEQWVSSNRENIFPFFSESKNLEKITPPWLNFKIISQSTEHISKGTLIDYQISLKGLPMKWRTRITKWDPPRQFVDDQLKGPYKKWHHTHSFESFPNGTLMTDSVVYELPFGFIGKILASAYIKKDITKIFSYRRKIINQLKDQWK